MPSPRLLQDTPRRPAARLSAARLALLPLTLVAPLLGGCYSYRPLASTAVAPRSEVRLLLTPDGARQLRESAGFEMRQLDGLVVQALADSAVLVKPTALVTVDGDELPWRRGDLVVPWRAVERSQQRTMDRKRTRGFVAAMGAVFAGVAYFALKSIAGGGGATLQPGPGAPE